MESKKNHCVTSLVGLYGGQANFAKMCKVTRQTVGRWERLGIPVPYVQALLEVENIGSRYSFEDLARNPTRSV